LLARRPWRPGSHSAALLFVWAALLAACSAGAAEPAPATGESEQSAPAPPEIVPVGELASRLEGTEALLRKTRNLLEAGDSVSAAEANLPPLRTRVVEGLNALGGFLASNPARDRLSGAIADWQYRIAVLSQWKDRLATRADRLEKAAASLEAERDLWIRTRREAKASGVPQAVRARLDATIESCESTLTLVRTSRNAVLTVQEQFVQLELDADEAIERITAAKDDFRARLFHRDAPVLWRDLSAFRFGAQREAVLEDLGEDWRSLREFARSRAPQILLDALIFSALLYGSLALRRRVAKWTESDPELGRSAVMFQRPYSMALLATIILLPAFHGTRPSVVGELVRLILLIPVVRLLAPLFERELRPLLGVVSGLYVLMRVQDLFDASVLGKQILFCIQLLVSIGFLLWLMRPARLKLLPASAHLPGGLRLGTRVALALLLASLVAGALGFRSLSTLLGNGVLTATFLALVAYAAVRAADVVLRVLRNTERARRLGLVRQRGDALLRTTTRAVTALMGVLWLLLTLDAFAIRDPLVDGLRSMLAFAVEVGELSLSLGDVLAFFVTLAAAFAVSSIIRFFLVEEVFTRMNLRRGIPYAISTLLHYVILMLGLILALAAAGMDFTKVTLLAGAFGVGIGFGLQTVVNNFVSGLILLFERPIQTGDIIVVGGLMGEVRRIGARSSTVRTFDGAEVIVPNATLISENVVNWTLSDRLRRIEVRVGVAYGTDPERVLEILRRVASENAAVLKFPEPTALFQGFGDSSLDFLLWAWTSRFEEGLGIQSELSVQICAALAEAGIEIPFPQRDLHLRSVPDANSGGSGPPEQET